MSVGDGPAWRGVWGYGLLDDVIPVLNLDCESNAVTIHFFLSFFLSFFFIAPISSPKML